jgi:DNA-binding MarR family transcriptional regulator/Spy/CpxP family protein refolding chaperone
VEDVILRGTVTMLAGTVDTNTRSYSNRSGFKAEVIIDDDQQIPDSVTEGMQAKVEILVKELTGKHQLIKVPNQCITSRTFSKENSETGCWVLNDNGENDWRPVIIVYHDEDYIAIEDEEVIQKCIRIIAEHGEANATKLEESLDLSSPRVERILEELGKRKVLGPRKNTDKPREILMDLTEEKIRQIPQRLRFQAAEPFEDVNNNKLWDEGEKFTDINKNGEYEKGEQVLLTPLSEADKLDLAESIENKSRVKGILGEAANKLTEKSGKTQSETPAKRGGSQSAGTMTAGHPRDSGGSQGDAGGNPYAQLDLKEDQKKKLDSARQERATGMRGLRDTPREERNAKIQELREAYEYKVEGILTPEQYKKYQEARPQRRPGQGGFDHGRRGGGD